MIRIKRCDAVRLEHRPLPFGISVVRKRFEGESEPEKLEREI
jgi:hypothetical protein